MKGSECKFVKYMEGSDKPKSDTGEKTDGS